MTSTSRPPPPPLAAQHPVDAVRIAPPARCVRGRAPSLLLVFASLGFIVLASILMARWW